MVEPARGPATYQDVLDAPEHMIAEIIDGRLELQPRPAKPHAISASALGAQLNVAFQLGQSGPGGWWIVDEPEIHFGANVLVPDVAGWRKADVPELSVDVAYFQEAPTWVCEVLSPGTERRDRIEKLRIYGEGGVGYVWLVHPTRRTLEVYVREQDRWVLEASHSDDESVQAPPFQDYTLKLDTLWL